ncbi:MAG: hypothetical protein WB615_08485 [Candidatus Tumulicola sp.]
MKRFMYHTAALAVAVALVACSGSKGRSGPAYGTGDPSLAAPNSNGSVNPFLTDGQAVVRALDAIEARTGKPLRVTLISANAMGGLTIDVQERASHGKLDRYQVAPNGTILGPVPEKLVTARGTVATAADIERQAFDPRALAFAHLAQTERDAIAKANDRGARVAEWDVGGIRPGDRRLIYIQTARGNLFAVIDPQFHIVRIRESGT